MTDTGLTTFTTSAFTGSGNCALCHSGLVDSSGADVSIDSHWRSTMMGNAAKDPLWQAKVSSEVARFPALQGVIEEKCSRCHTPMARTQASTDGVPVGLLDGGFLDPSHALHEAAMDGVSCSLCHQIQDVDLGLPDSYTGGFAIDTSALPPDRPIFGSFADPFTNPMRMHVGYTPVQGVQMSESALCGTCHTLYTPVVDASGQLLGIEFPEQTPFLEWAHSSYANSAQEFASCQECHMPEAAGSVVVSNRPWWLEGRPGFEQHYFVGGNAFMLSMLRTSLAELGVTATAGDLDATITRTVDQLHTGTAALSVVEAQVSGSTLTFAVDVHNLAGHKLPSGIPLRRVWLNVMVRDKRGRIVFESGRAHTNGAIAGNDADAFPGAYEPHYDVITASDQVQIYEPVMLDSDGLVTYTFIRAASYAKDNRLLPLGFDKATAGDDFAVRGAAATDVDFVGGSDRVMYQVNVQGARMPLRVTAKLQYQAIGHRAYEDLRSVNTPQVADFSAMYSAMPKAPVTLASVETAVR